MEHTKHTAPGECAVVEERRNSDTDAAELREPRSFKSTAKQVDDGAKPSEPAKKRCSAPEPRSSHSNSAEGRNHFDRRRIWSAHKQDSIDFPEELECQTEDNVFLEIQRSRQDQRGRLTFQRSLSVPATLPDVVPERGYSSENASPDVLFNRGKEDDSCSGVKSTSSCSSLVCSGKMLEELEKRKDFEGSVRYNSVSSPPVVKRKKSVTFDRTVSDRGLQARSHFRSSGYGSQSDGSQASQASNQSSEQGSVLSDDVLEEKRSFEACDLPCVDQHSLRSTSIDGSIDNAKEEDPRGETRLQASHTTVQKVDESGCIAPAPEDAHSHPNSTQTPEELIDDTELWRRQFSPKFHFHDMDPADDLPNLSIFENEEETSSSSVCYSAVAGDDFSSQHKQLLEHPGGTYDGVDGRNDIPLPSQSFEQNAGIYGAKSSTGVANTENSENKTSPTTKEECQRDLFKRIFEERMVKFDNSKESLSDLLEWFKNNIGEALTPSPKSPFFPAGGPPLSQNYKVPEAIASTLLGIGPAGNTGFDRLGVPVQTTARMPVLPVHNFPGDHLVPYVPVSHGCQLTQQTINCQRDQESQHINDYQGRHVYQQINFYQGGQTVQQINYQGVQNSQQTNNYQRDQKAQQSVNRHSGRMNQQVISCQGGQQPKGYQGGQQPNSYHGGQQPNSYQRGQQPNSYQGGQQPSGYQGGQPVQQTNNYQGGQMAWLPYSYQQRQPAWHSTSCQGGQPAPFFHGSQFGQHFLNLGWHQPVPNHAHINQGGPVQPPGPAHREQPVPSAARADNVHRGTPVPGDQQRGDAMPVIAQPNCARPGPPTTHHALSTIPYESTLMESSSVGLSSNLSSGVRDSDLEQLVNFSQCSLHRCMEDTCVQNKKRLESLKEALKTGPSDLDADNIDLLRLLHEHFISCELPNCHVPWCRCLSLIHQCQEGQERNQQELVRLLSNPLHTLLPPSVHFDTYMKLDPSLLREERPREWEDWLVLYPMSDTFTVARAVLLPDNWTRQHWVVKMSSLPEEGSQLDVLRKLRDLKHPHIINHIWMASSSSSSVLVVCTAFLPGISVRDLLDQAGPLSCALVYEYLIQILDATQHLHSRSIIYLNWTCSNLLLDQDCQEVKISNFTSSVDLSSDSADIGIVKLSLPADIVPTELLVQGGELTDNSDSWGLGCVLHEMLTGIRPWYHLRHYSKEDTWTEILKQVPPELSGDLSECPRLQILTCLQKSPEERMSVGEMMNHIQRERY